LNLAIQGLNQDIDRAEQRAHRFCPEYDDEHTMWIKVNTLETEKEMLKQHLHELVVSEPPKTSICNDILNKYVIIDDDGPTPKRSKNGSTESSDYSTNSSK
jgi:16S rRNA C967 or C1407 C5-methylase (RsmB/RsmF family)